MIQDLENNFSVVVEKNKSSLLCQFCDGVAIIQQTPYIEGAAYCDCDFIPPTFTEE